MNSTSINSEMVRALVVLRKSKNKSMTINNNTYIRLSCHPSSWTTIRHNTWCRRDSTTTIHRSWPDRPARACIIICMKRTTWAWCANWWALTSFHVPEITIRILSERRLPTIWMAVQRNNNFIRFHRMAEDYSMENSPTRQISHSSSTTSSSIIHSHRRRRIICDTKAC